MGHLRRTKGSRAGGRFTEETGLVGGLTSLKRLMEQEIFNPGD